ncbi:MAG TPA: hypothetical protein VM056_02820 [Terriglobales bacterium]|nr:hypothetical protein [Terriglobales bacterium]
MSPMMMMLVLLGVMLTVLTILVIYRNTLEMHEDDQLFLNDSESHMAKEQAELQKKMGTIEPMVKWLGAASVVVMLALVGMWLYQGLNRPIS